MSVVWADLAARARGLAARLLTPEELDALAAAPDLRTLAQRLDSRFGPGLLPGGGDPETIEGAIRRRAAGLLATLGRWAGGRRRRGCLDVVFAEEDRRSLRGIFRGLAAGDRPEARIAGALPTLRLPAPALAELARQSHPRAVLTLLSVWGHPFAGAPHRRAGGRDARHRDGDRLATSRRWDTGWDEAVPEALALFRLELRLARAWAAAAAPGGRAGGPELRRWIGHRIDLENAATALAVASRGLVETRTEDLFLPGGGHLSSALFTAACGAGSPEAAREALARELAGTPSAVALARIGTAAGEPRSGPQAGLGPVHFERFALHAEGEELRHRALLEPLSAAPILLFVNRLHQEMVALRRLVWSTALAARPAPSPAFGGAS